MLLEVLELLQLAAVIRAGVDRMATAAERAPAALLGVIPRNPVDQFGPQQIARLNRSVATQSFLVF